MFFEEKLAAIILLGLIIFGCIGTVLFFTGFHHQIKSGEHTGYITAVQTEGIIFETASVYVKTEISSSQEDRYCVRITDTELLNQLKVKAETQEKVTVEYIAYLFNGITTCQGEVDIITAIK